MFCFPRAGLILYNIISAIRRISLVLLVLCQIGSNQQKSYSILNGNASLSSIQHSKWQWPTYLSFLKCWERQHCKISAAYVLFSVFHSFSLSRCHFVAEIDRLDRVNGCEPNTPILNPVHLLFFLLTIWQTSNTFHAHHIVRCTDSMIMKYIIVIAYYDDRSLGVVAKPHSQRSLHCVLWRYHWNSKYEKRKKKCEFFGLAKRNPKRERRKYHIEAKTPTTNGRIILLFMWNEKCFRKRKLRARENTHTHRTASCANALYGDGEWREF